MLYVILVQTRIHCGMTLVFEHVCFDTGFSKLDMYSRKYSFIALSLLDTESQPSSLNICSDGVLNSACSIILAARFCHFDRRSICVPAVDPRVTEL